MLFSIIVPIYNVEKYLPKCLDSLINQTYKDIEIICINDGSTDNSLKISEDYASRDCRIKVINQENQGVSVARNKGIEFANGEYILFVDADDWLDTKTCNIIYENIRNSDKDFDLISFNSFNVKQQQAIKGLNKTVSSVLIGEMWSICYRKNYLYKFNIRFPQNIKIAEDHIFKCHAVINTNNLLVLKDYLYYYLLDRKNSSSKVSSVINDNINSFYNLISQDWFINADEKKQVDIIDFWIRLINGTLLNININCIDTNILDDFMFSINNLKRQKDYNLKRFRTLKIYIYLIKLRLWNIYVKLLRPLCKYCMVLPFRKIKKVFRIFKQTF